MSVTKAEDQSLKDDRMDTHANAATAATLLPCGDGKANVEDPSSELVS